MRFILGMLSWIDNRKSTMHINKMKEKCYMIHLIDADKAFDKNLYPLMLRISHQSRSRREIINLIKGVYKKPMLTSYSIVEH